MAPPSPSTHQLHPWISLIFFQGFGLGSLEVQRHLCNQPSASNKTRQGPSTQRQRFSAVSGATSLTIAKASEILGRFGAYVIIEPQHVKT